MGQTAEMFYITLILDTYLYCPLYFHIGRKHFSVKYSVKQVIVEMRQIPDDSHRLENNSKYEKLLSHPVGKILPSLFLLSIAITVAIAVFLSVTVVPVFAILAVAIVGAGFTFIHIDSVNQYAEVGQFAILLQFVD